MQRLIITSFICSLLFAGACSSIQHSANESGKISYRLEPDDIALASAMASYSSALIAEMEQGRGSAKVLEHFVQAAEKDPSSYMLARRASTALLYKGRGNDAADIMESHTEVNPSNYTALLDLAQIYHIDRQDAESLNAYKRAIKASPTNPAAYIACAQSCLTSGMMDEALEVLAEGAKHSNAQLMSDIALIHSAALVKGGLPGKSVPWFEFAAKHSESNSSRILLILAEIHESMDKTAEALNAYQRAVNNTSAGPEAYVRLALFHNKKSFPDALEALTKGVKRFPESDILLTSIVYLASINNSLEAALEIFEKVVKASLKNPSEEFFLQIGGLYEQTGSFKKAEETFKEGLAAYPHSHIMLNYLAYMWADKGLNLDEAETLADKAVKAEPHNGAYLDTLGWIYFRQERHEEARSYMRKALKVLPDDPVINEHLGDVLAKQGEIDEAIKAWQRSFELDRSNEPLMKKLIQHGVIVEQEKD